MQERSQKSPNFLIQPWSYVRVCVCVAMPAYVTGLLSLTSFCFSLPFLSRSIFISSCFQSHLHYWPSPWPAVTWTRPEPFHFKNCVTHWLWCHTIPTYSVVLYTLSNTVLAYYVRTLKHLQSVHCIVSSSTSGSELCNHIILRISACLHYANKKLISFQVLFKSKELQCVVVYSSPTVNTMHH